MKKIIIALIAVFFGVQAFAQGGLSVSLGASYSLYDFSPTAGVTAAYAFPGSFIGLFLEVDNNSTSHTLEGGPSPLVEKRTITHIMPGVRLYYLQKRKCRLYSGFGFGLRRVNDTETFEGSTVGASSWGFTAQDINFGFSFGRRLTLDGEFGLGTAWVGAKFGLGYKF
jgi:hypothetical protein